MFDREIAGIAVSFLDRFLALRSANKYIFQLASLCSLFVAAKLHGSRPIRMVREVWIELVVTIQKKGLIIY